MTSQKCTKCGLVSWAETATCKRCGDSLVDQMPTDMSTHEDSEPSKLPDVISCGLLILGVACLVLNKNLGPFGYPGSILAFIAGLAYSTVRVHRSRQDPQRDDKRAAISGLVANVVLLMIFGAAVPVYVLGGRNPETRPFEWREYASARGGYTVQLPDDPEEVQKKIETPKGSLMLNAVTVNMGKRGEYASGYYDLSDRPLPLDEEGFLQAVLQESFGRSAPVGQKRVVFASPAGLHVRALEGYVYPDAQSTMVMRLYWVRERSTVYVTAASFEVATTNFVSAEKFLDSFKLVTP